MRFKMRRTALVMALVMFFLPPLVSAQSDLLGTLQNHDPNADSTSGASQSAPTQLLDTAPTGQTSSGSGSLLDQIFNRLTSIFERLTKIMLGLLDMLSGGKIANNPTKDNGTRKEPPAPPKSDKEKPKDDKEKPKTDKGSTLGPAPHGRSGIEKMFGSRGTNQVTTTMPAGPGGKEIKVTCNKKIADKLRAVFEEIKAQGLSKEIHTFDGCYCNRLKRGGSTPSVHSWGIAVDINASENPMGPNKQTAGQKKLAAIFEKYGFHQLPNDRMHFQYCTGY